MTSHSPFREHYAGLHEDELVHIALTRDLIPQAKEALQQELAQRGITDLTQHRQQMEQERVAQEERRQVELERRSATSGWSTKIGYGIGGLMFLYGAFCAAVPQADGQDATILIALGPAVVLGTWVMAKMNKMWGEKVLFRQPPQ